MTIVIVGSGLAGLSCAWELAKAGHKVTVLEARDVLGGRTSSWTEDGMPVESGLHKFLGIYRALPRLLREVGVDTDRMLTWVDELAFLNPDGRNGDFIVAPYRHPVRTVIGLLANNHFLSPSDKVRFAAFTVAGISRCLRDPSRLDHISLAEYAAGFGISHDALHRALFTSTQAILFLEADRFSAYAAFAPVVEGLKHFMTFRIGAFNGGMSDVMMKPIAAAIERRGGVVRLNAPVVSLACESDEVRGVHLANESMLADHTVLAVPVNVAQDLLRLHFESHPWFKSFFQLPTLSCATIQFELTEPLLPSDRTNFSPTSLCCFAEQSRTTFTELPGRLSAILYPPDDFLSNDDQAAARAYAAAEQLRLPLQERTTRWRIVRHPNAFYRMEPGTEARRPTQKTPIPGLALAGDYTRQPFSASMEGAALSGQLAAESILQRE